MNSKDKIDYIINAFNSKELEKYECSNTFASLTTGELNILIDRAKQEVIMEVKNNILEWYIRHYYYMSKSAVILERSIK